MSVEYSYYAAYKNKNDHLLYPIGPFIKIKDKYEYKPILTRSGSFASDLYRSFDRLTTDDCHKSLLDALGFENVEDIYGLHAIPYKNSERFGEFEKEGYVPISDVQEYKDYQGDYSFYDILSPEVYAGMLISNNPKAKDYMYYKWIEYNSAAYEWYLITNFVEDTISYHECDYDDIYIICMVS